MNSKKILLPLALLGGVTIAHAKMEMVTVNSQQLLMSSARGKALQAEIEQEAKSLQEFQQTLQADLQEASQNFQEQAPLMTAEAQQDGLFDLSMQESDAQADLQRRKQKLQARAKQKEEAARRSLNQVAANMLDEKEWGVMVDSAQPGVLATAKSIDVTDQVLERANEIFNKENQQLAMLDVDEEVTA
jgi:Skp family chaperone for outer membrane proteins